MPQIFYLDSLPGTGKTRYFLKEARKPTEDLIFYVSPTHLLLDQVYADLLSTEGLSRGEHPVEEERIYRFNGSASLGMFRVRDHVLRILDGGVDDSGAERPPAPPGSIFLLTHECFLRLPLLKRQKEIRVYFDEARKLVINKEEPLRFRKGQDLESFKDALRQYGFPVPGTPFIRFSVPLRVSAAVSAKRASDKFSESRAQFNTLVDVFQMASNPRLDLYVYVREDEHRSEYRFQEIIVPRRLFEGYKYVLLLSAYFPDSQMFHLLEAEGETPINLMRENQNLFNRFDNRSSDIRFRFSAVTIILLTDDSSKVSRTRYEGSLMVKSEHLNWLKTVQQELMNSGKDLRSAVQRIRQTEKNTIRMGQPPLSPAEIRLQEFFEKTGTHRSVISWYMNSALRVIRKLGDRVINKPILVLNNAETRYLHENQPEDVDTFHQISAFCNGINEHQESNTIVYLSAINPHPRMVRLFKIIMPKYDPDRDHAADSCVQAITRLSVRDSESIDRVYVVLPDRGLADLLLDKMMWLPKVSTSFSDHEKTFSYSMISERTVDGRRRMSEGGKRGGKMSAQRIRELYKHVRSPERVELEKKLASNYAMRSALRKKIANSDYGPTGVELSRQRELRKVREDLKARIAVIHARDNPDIVKRANKNLL